MKNLLDEIRNKKDDKEKLTEAEAYEKLKNWSDILEVRLNDEDFEEVQKELFKMIINERLSFDEDSEEFTYALRKPINLKDGKSIGIIKILDCQMVKKREMTKYKNEIDKTISLIQIYTSYEDNEEYKEIPFGHVQKLMSNDQNVLSAVILGFFVQVVPG